MILAVIGSRSFNDYDLMKLELSKLDFTEIVSGGARGADLLAEKYAKEFNIPIKVFSADWDKYGKSAGFIRNYDIISYSDFCIAFWDGQSHGTNHSIKLCYEQKKRCEIINFTSKLVTLNLF